MKEEITIEINILSKTIWKGNTDTNRHTLEEKLNSKLRQMSRTDGRKAETGDTVVSIRIKPEFLNSK